MPQKSPVANNEAKSVPVKTVYFTQAIKWPGIAGAGMAIQSGEAGANTRANILHVESIYLYRDEFVIDGKYFMPKTAACILCYDF